MASSAVDFDWRRTEYCAGIQLFWFVFRSTVPSSRSPPLSVYLSAMGIHHEICNHRFVVSFRKCNRFGLSFDTNSHAVIQFECMSHRKFGAMAFRRCLRRCLETVFRIFDDATVVAIRRRIVIAQFCAKIFAVPLHLTKNGRRTIPPRMLDAHTQWQLIIIFYYIV